MTLNQLYQDHQGKVSDKWSLYIAEYDRLFSSLRTQSIRLLEIGIQNGGSLEIWSKYFPAAEQFVGCDINPDCRLLAYDDPRIAVVVADANLDATQEVILGHAPSFHLIIDDGSHTSSDIVKSFARYFPYLEDGGIFVAEDLHCSYWQEFEGGLFDPFSAVAFFKALADVVNQEHWGIPAARGELLEGFAKKYEVSFDESILAHIHSVEFINSICVVRKAAPSGNRLGTRVVGGRQALVVEGLKQMIDRGSEWRAPDQTLNVWTAKPVKLDDELIQHLIQSEKTNAELSKALAQQEQQATADRNALLFERDAALQELNGLLCSRSWKITAPFRWIQRQIRRLGSS